LLEEKYKNSQKRRFIMSKVGAAGSLVNLVKVGGGKSGPSGVHQDHLTRDLEGSDRGTGVALAGLVVLRPDQPAAGLLTRGGLPDSLKTALETIRDGHDGFYVNHQESLIADLAHYASANSVNKSIALEAAQVIAAANGRDIEGSKINGALVALINDVRNHGHVEQRSKTSFAELLNPEKA
jgi:hypothetical protein